MPLHDTRRCRQMSECFLIFTLLHMSLGQILIEANKENSAALLSSLKPLNWPLNPQKGCA